MTDIFLPEALADLFVRSGLLLLLAWAAAAAIGRAGAPAASRHLVWLLSLAALLLLPLLGSVLPALPLPVLPPEPVPAAPMTLAPAMPAAPIAEPVDPGAALAWAIYALVAAAVAARLLLGGLLLTSRWRRSDDHPALQDKLDRLRSQLGIARPVRLRLSRDSAMPLTWGMLNPRILLPAEAASWTEERLRLVLLHELAHVSRFDSPARLAAGLACATYWFQPLIWLAGRKLRIEQEHAADDLVLAAGARPRTYAFSLLEVAGGRAPGLAGGLHAAMAGPSDLERRLSAIVAPRARGRPGRTFVAAAIFAASASALFAASALPVAPIAEAVPVAPVEPVRAVGPVATMTSAARPAVRDTVAPVPPAAPGTQAEDVHPTLALAGMPPIELIRAVPALPAVAALPATLEAYEGVPDESERQAAVEAYRRARAVYRLQRREYHAQLGEYHRQVKEQHRQVAALRREGNLVNSGNDGNAGNVGNEGNEGGPGHMPVFPTAPTAPTPPTPPSPIYRRLVAVASAEPIPASQGP